MPQLNDDQIQAARDELDTMLNRLIGNSTRTLIEEVGGTGEYYQEKYPKHPFTQYYEAFGENPAAIIYDLKRRFPDVFNTYGFGDASTVNQDTAATDKNATFSGGLTAGLDIKKWLLPGAVVGGLLWYFKPWK